MYYTNKRSPMAAPYLNDPANHDIAPDRPALAAHPFNEDRVVPDPRATRDERGQFFYKSKNGPGDRGEYSVSYDEGEMR